MEYELKPCPFCGGTATLKQDPTQSWYIECFCGVFKGYYTKKQNAIDAWNRRATDANVGDGWISVKDELPKEDGEFLVLYGGKKAGIRLFLNGTFRLNYESAKSYETLTHWRPLPKPPEGEKDDG